MYKNGQYFFDPRINNYANQSALAKVIDNPDDFTTKEIRDTASNKDASDVGQRD